MSAKDDTPGQPASGSASRTERLEAELRANLRRRKDQARARAQAGIGDPDGAENAGNSKSSGETDSG